MARVLIVGCGCRGQALAAALGEHPVRGTTRSRARLPELEAAGIEGVVADPDRVGTLVPALIGVTVICWLMGSAEGSPDVNEARLGALMQHLVDTPVRGLVYEASGTAEPDRLAAGAEIVRAASRTWHIPVEVVTADPAPHEDWLKAMEGAVAKLLD